MSAKVVVPRLQTQQWGVSPEHAYAALQDAVRKSLAGLHDNPLLSGRLVEDVALSTTPTAVPHKLGRQPLGWFLVDIDADARVWRTAWDSKHITLDASAACNAAIWIF